MKRTTGLLLPCLLVTCLGAPQNATGDDKGGHGGGHATLMPDKLQWVPNPSLPPGARVALLSGDPGKPGDLYALRLKLPDGYKVPPHWHPADENVTVLEGTMLFGEGEKFDEAAMKEAPAGSFTRMPKGVRHYAMARGETLIQLHGIGPFEIHYVNPSDDPRRK